VLRRCVWSRNIKNRCSIYIYDISSLRVNELHIVELFLTNLQLLSLSKKSFYLMKPQGSSLCSQQLATSPYPESMNSVHALRSYCFKVHFNIIFIHKLSFSCLSFPWHLTAETVSKFLLSPYVLRAWPICFFLILWLYQWLLRITNVRFPILGSFQVIGPSNIRHVSLNIYHKPRSRSTTACWLSVTAAVHICRPS